MSVDMAPKVMISTLTEPVIEIRTRLADRVELDRRCSDDRVGIEQIRVVIMRVVTHGLSKQANGSSCFHLLVLLADSMSDDNRLRINKS